ncbi:hypothetical protein C8245_23015 [Paracidovorax avenae]|uniref:DUF6475 domain-containing protein n=1 Tax=Paracidovorax avenae TaxID=80867 RepID=UPI000D21310E|nr:DUF6475 domain-containing protein [Paracidovorax avenae]AVS68149.1 hypothetical protein C8245_23015 [Paracidovorax avenae]
MRDEDREDFAVMVTATMAYYRQDISDFVLDVWWNACRPFDFEQIKKAINRHIADPEHGKFPIGVADVARLLQGTATDRAAVAWGKCHDAMSRVGAWQNVVFDDPAIHAVIEDLGGWSKLCRMPLPEMGHVQHRFLEAHRAYTRLESFDYPRMLQGAADGAGEYAKYGLKPPKPVIVGDVERARLVYQGGSKAGKTAITTSITALLASPKARLAMGATDV